jgi:predicted ATPase
MSASRPAAADAGPTLVERDREVASLRALVGDARRGHGRVVLIEGPAGIGKSRLLAETRSAAAGAGMLVLAARGSELEREFPFGAVRQLFEAVVADPARRDSALAGAAAPAQAVLGSLPDGRDDHGDASFAALHGLFWLALNLAADRPLLLAIDDLQWCDRPRGRDRPQR